MPSRRTAVCFTVLALVVLAARSAPATAQGSPAAQGRTASLFDPATLSEFSFTFRDADWEGELARLADTDAYIHADLLADGEALPDIGVRIKGNSSSRAPGRKEPLNLGLDAFVSGQRLAGYDTLNLNNLFADPTMVREVLTYSALRPFIPVPRASFARMNAGGRYFGLYSLVQQIEKTYVREWFPSADGYLFKADPPGGMGGGRGPSDLSWQGEDLERYKSSYELKTTVEDDAAWVALRELSRILDAPAAQGGSSDDDLAARVEQVLDVDGVLWYVAAHNLLANFDSYYSRHNYYLYQTPDDGRFHILSWDMNESFGVFRPPDGTAVSSATVARIDPFVASGGGEGQPLLRRLLAVPAYRQDYLAHYRTLLAEILDIEALTAKVAGLQNLIRESARTDLNPLYGFELFERALWEDVTLPGGGPNPGGGGGGRAVPGLLELAALRAEWLASRPDMAAPDVQLGAARVAPEPVVADQAAQITVELSGRDAPVGVTLVYQVEGGKPVAVEMTPSGAGHLAQIPAQSVGTTVRYFVRAEVADARAVFFPAANWTQPWSYTVTGPTLPVGQTGALVLNEVQADNATTLADPAGEFDDWVELYNRGGEAVGLADYYLSDDAADPHQFALPDVALAPGGYLLIWCDSDPEQGPEHAPFKIAKEGDSVYLSTAAETVDTVTLPPQVTDHSYARGADGAEAWLDCAAPSPGARNSCAGNPPTSTPTASTATPTTTRETPTMTPVTGTPPGPTPVPAASLYLPRAEAGRSG